jgi:hypothetical protein
MQQGHVRIVCPSKQLGYLPCPPNTFHLAAQAAPDYYCWNSGSSAPDPALIGIDVSLSLYEWQKHDLELALLAARRQQVPLLIGTAGDTGANSRVDVYVECLRHLAHKHNLSPFTLAYVQTEISKQALTGAVEQASALPWHEAISDDKLARTDRILAVAGGYPYRRALELGADVIIGGRSCQASMMAAAALRHGVPAASAYTLAVMLTQCASAAAPGQAVLGTIDDEAVRVSLLGSGNTSGNPGLLAAALTALGPPGQHALADGLLDLSTSQVQQDGAAAVIVTVSGAVFIPAEAPFRIRLEAVGKVGDRHRSILNLSADLSLADVARAVERTRAQLDDHFTGTSCQLTYHAYERLPLAVVLNPSLHSPGWPPEPRESAFTPGWFLLIDGLAETGQLAEELTLLATRLLMATLRASRGDIAERELFTLKGALAAPPLYCWTLDGAWPVTQPDDVFEVHVITIA